MIDVHSPKHAWKEISAEFAGNNDLECHLVMVGAGEVANAAIVFAGIAREIGSKNAAEVLVDLLRKQETALLSRKPLVLLRRFDQQQPTLGLGI